MVTRGLAQRPERHGALVDHAPEQLDGARYRSRLCSRGRDDPGAARVQDERLRLGASRLAVDPRRGDPDSRDWREPRRTFDGEDPESIGHRARLRAGARTPADLRAARRCRASRRSAIERSGGHRGWSGPPADDPSRDDSSSALRVHRRHAPRRTLGELGVLDRRLRHRTNVRGRDFRTVRELRAHRRACGRRLRPGGRVRHAHHARA